MGIFFLFKKVNTISHRIIDSEVYTRNETRDYIFFQEMIYSSFSLALPLPMSGEFGRKKKAKKDPRIPDENESWNFRRCNLGDWFIRLRFLFTMVPAFVLASILSKTRSGLGSFQKKTRVSLGIFLIASVGCIVGRDHSLGVFYRFFSLFTPKMLRYERMKRGDTKLKDMLTVELGLLRSRLVYYR